MKSLRKSDPWVDEPSWASPQDNDEVTWRARRPALDFLRVSAVALGTAAFWMFLIWAIHRESPRTLVSFHGFIHAAIADKFLDPASTAFPPENPFFAGQPLPYYWFFQFLAAQLTRYLEWNIFYSLEAVTLAATGLLVTIAVGLGRVLFRSTLAGVFMSYLVMVGTNPFGFLFAGLKIVSQGKQGLLDDPDYLWGVVHPLYSLIRYNDFGGIYGPLLNFFLNQTSRPAALACLMAQLFFLEWSLRSRRYATWVSLGCASALCTAFSPITGICAGGALLAGLTISLLWDGHGAKGTRGICVSNAKLVAAWLSIAGGIVLAVPTYYHLLLGPSSGHVQFRLVSLSGLRDIVTIVLNISLLMCLAAIGLIRQARNEGLILRTTFLAALLLLAANMAFLIPPGNESNFFHAAAVFLVGPAAGSVFRVRGLGEKVLHRNYYLAGISLAFVPTVLLLLAAYIDRPALPASFSQPRLARLPQDSDLAVFYDWVQHETSPRAIFILDPRQQVAMCGNAAEFPAMTGRVLFTEKLGHYLAPYTDAKTRFELTGRLLTGDTLTDGDMTYLSRFNRPIYIVFYESRDGVSIAPLEKRYGQPIFHRGDLAVFKWRT
jgi:Uncharacterized membrane protein (DUF2298)